MSGAWLLDVNALVGLLWSVHALHGRANAWFARVELATLDAGIQHPVAVLIA